MFLIRYYDSDLGYVVLQVRPAPGRVSYPEGDDITVRPSLVVQRPDQDTRPRKWIWEGYRDSIPRYKNLWDTLHTLKVKLRWAAGYTDPRVQIWENVTEEGGFGETTDGLTPDLVTYTNLKWTWVRITQVHRKTRPAGGPITYDTSTVEFYIDDENWTDF